MTEHITATPERLRRVAEALGFDAEAYSRARELAGFAPDGNQWARLIDRFFVVVGVLFLLAGVAAFFAYNWADLHKFAKFGLIQTGIVAAVLLAWWRGLDSPEGKGALFAAAFLTGLLLALYGQVYQTGADPYGLFLTWVVLIAGWVIIGRQAALWMLALVLLNLSLILYWAQVRHAASLGSEFGPLAGIGMFLFIAPLASWVFALNAAALVIWEVCAASGIAGTAGRWFPRVAAVGALLPVVATSFVFIIDVPLDAEQAGLLNLLLLAAFIAASFWYYRVRVRDLLILTMCVAGVIVLATTYFGRVLDIDDDTAILLAILLVAQTAGAALLLRKIHSSWESQ